MGWKAYRLVYQAKSHVHIGWHTLGYIKLTRYYITGKNMWASFTDNLARADGSIKDTTNYKIYGEELLNKSIFISYFYPALFQNDELKLLMPEYTGKGLYYGDYSASEFERLFIKSYGQTAVLPESNTAEDESLHESEFIAPIIEDEDTKNQMPVYFVGYIFIEESATVNTKSVGWNGSKDIRLKEIFSEIFVGGDRKYGWGRLILDNEKTGEVIDNNFFEHEIVSGEKKIKITKNKPIPAHLPINSSLNLKGDIEPLVGREWGEIQDSKGNKKIGSGQKISDAIICWMPGSILEETEDNTLTIGHYGILVKE